MSSRRKKNGSLSLSDRIKLLKIYRKGAAAYGSSENLKKKSGHSKAKVELFLQSEDSYTKHKEAKRRHQRLRVHSRYKNEI